MGSVMYKKNISITGFIGPFNLGIASFIFAFIGQYFLYYLKNTLWGAMFFLAAVILFFAADRRSAAKELFLPEKTGDNPHSAPSKKEIFIFIMIILVSVFFRAYRISEIPPACDRDEAKLCLDTMDIMENRVPDGGNSALPVYIKTLTDNPALYNYFVSFFYAIAGNGDIQARFAGITAGVLAVIALYFLLRYLFGPAVAAAGGFLFAAMRWHITLSRLIYHAGLAVPLFIFVLYFMYKAYRNGKTSDFALLGITLGLSLYTYQAARVIPVALFLICACALILDQDFRKKQCSNIAVSAVIFFVISEPLLLYAANHMNDFFIRSRALYIFDINNMAIFSTEGLKNPLEIYLNSLSSALLMFNKTGDLSLAHNIPYMPMLGFFTGIFSVMGFFCVARRIRNPYAAVTMFLFICALHGTVLFRGAYKGILSYGAPESTRVVLEIPLVIVFSAAYISRMREFLMEQYGGTVRGFFTTVFAAILLLESYQGYNNYFLKAPTTTGYFSRLNGDQKTAAHYLKSLGNANNVIIDRYFSVEYNRGGILYYYLDRPKQPLYGTFDPKSPFTAGKYPNTGIVYVLKPENWSVLPKLWKKYPAGIYREFYSPFDNNNLLFFSFEVPKPQPRV